MGLYETLTKEMESAETPGQLHVICTKIARLSGDVEKENRLKIMKDLPTQIDVVTANIHRELTGIVGKAMIVLAEKNNESD